MIRLLITYIIILHALNTLLKTVQDTKCVCFIRVFATALLEYIFL